MRSLIPLVLLIAITCGSHGSIQLPDSLVHETGEIIDFKIPSDINAESYGTNYLPIGLTLNPTTGVISGIPLETGNWKTIVFAVNTENYDAKTISWHIVESGESHNANHSYITAVTETDIEINEQFLGPDDRYEVESVSGLPEGIIFDPFAKKLKGSSVKSGLFEIVFKQTTGPSKFYSHIILSVFPAGLNERFELPASDTSKIAYFKGKYYYPSAINTISVSDDLKNWQTTIPKEGTTVKEFGIFKDRLIGMAYNSVLVSSDGINYDRFPLPENLSAQKLIVGQNGIMIETNGANGRPILYSPDGENWSFASSPSEYINNVFPVEDLFYTYSSGEFQVTKDGTLWWTLKVEGRANLFHPEQIGYANRKFVAKGPETYEIYVSHDAIHWETLALNRSAKWTFFDQQEDRFFLWGRDREESENPTLLSSLDGYRWEPVNFGAPVWSADELAYVNHRLFIQQKSFNRKTATIDAGPILNTPGFYIPEYMEFPLGKYVYYPLNVTGSYSTLKAFGLPQGLKFDPNNGAIFGTAEIAGHPSKEAFFIGENQGVPGLIEDTHILSWETEGGYLPNINAVCVYGIVGKPLNNQAFYSYPEDHTSTVKLIGAPDWLYLDGYDFRGTPTNKVQTSFTVEVSNLFGTTSKEIALKVAEPVWSTATGSNGVPINFNYFSYGNGVYSGRTNFDSYWSKDLNTWTPTAPALTARGEIVSFKNHLYFVDEPRLYRSSDGRGWIPYELQALYNPRTSSVFASPEKIYCISDNKLVCSDDGVTWTVLKNGNRPPEFKVTYQGNYYFAYWFDDRIYRSSDALNWELVFDEPNDYLDILDIRFGNGIYLATLDDFEDKYLILRSSDGAKWERVNIPGEYFGEPTAFIYADGQFHLSTFNENYLRSTDGLNWKGYFFPHRSTTPRFDSFTWDGRDLYGITSSNGVFRLTGEIPPFVEPIYDARYIAGEPVDQAIGITGDTDHVEIYGLPDGLSVDVTARKVIGTPTKLGQFEARIIASFQGTSSEAVDFHGLVIDPSKVPNFTKDFHVTATGDVNIQIAEYRAVYNGFELSAESLPNNFQIYGFELTGDNVLAGVYSPTFSLISSNGLTKATKKIPVYVSPLLHPSALDQSFQLKGRKGVLITESVIPNNSVAVGSVTGLPNDLLYDPNKRQISGIPTRPGEFLITVDLLDQSFDLFYNLTISGDPDFTKPPLGTFGENQNTVQYRAQLESASNFTYRWFYDGYPLSDDSNTIGVNSSTLTLASLAGRDPHGFSVEVSREDQKTRVEVPFKNTLKDYEAWASSRDLTGTKADPLGFGFNGKFVNLFAYAQDGAGFDQFVPPSLHKTSDGYRFRFLSNRYWNQNDWQVLVYGDLRYSPIAVMPLVIEEGENYKIWEAIVGNSNADKLFVSLGAELVEP